MGFFLVSVMTSGVEDVGSFDDEVLIKHFNSDFISNIQLLDITFRNFTIVLWLKYLY